MKKQLSIKEKTEYIFVLNLLSYLLNKCDSVSIPEDIDYKAIYKYAKRNCIVNMISYALKKCGADIPDEFRKIIVYTQKFMLMKDASQYAATRKMITALENAGVDNLLVKGEFLKDTYPQPDYRVTADVDIHIRQNDIKKVVEVAESIGFSVDYQSDELLIIHQPPFAEFEMHADNGEFVDTVFGDNLFDKARLVENKKHTYKFPDNDHYVYVIEHFAKHYRDVSGMGVRMVMDVYCLYNSYKEKLDFRYINKQLKKSGTYNFHRMLLQKGKKYFESVMKVSDFDIVDTFILSNGIMGDGEILSNNLKRKFEDKYGSSGNKNYVAKRLFPPTKRMAEDYPVLNKAKFLLPFTWVHRDAKILFSKDRKQYLNNVKIYKQLNETDELDYLKIVMIESGFDM